VRVEFNWLEIVPPGEWAPLAFPVTPDELDDCAKEIVASCKVKGYIDG
jgi:hypothetical protein